MNFLNKIWGAISGLLSNSFGENNTSTEIQRKVHTKVIKGNSGTIVNGNVDNSIVTGPNSNVSYSGDAKCSKEKPTNQKIGDYWLTD